MPHLSPNEIDETDVCYLQRNSGLSSSRSLPFHSISVAIGLNIIDGRRIDEPELDQAVFVTGSEESAINVNTPKELEVARERFTKVRGADTNEMSLPRRVPRTYRLARISVFSALSVVGSFIHPESGPDGRLRFFAGLLRCALFWDHGWRSG